MLFQQLKLCDTRPIWPDIFYRLPGAAPFQLSDDPRDYPPPVFPFQ